MKNPNIILIISDAVRARDMSLYGYAKENDINIKKIAQESVVFEKNFTASNASDSSLTSIFSGNYPKTHGFIHQHPFMRQEELEKLKQNKFWLPLYLQQKGYTTISGTPLHLWFKRGFEFYKNREETQNKFLNNSIIKRFLLSLPNWAYKFGKRVFKKRASPQFVSSKETIDLAINKINENKKTSKPFFLFMHFTDTHYPYPVAKKNEDFGEKTIDKILETCQNQTQKEYVKKRFHDILAYSMEEIEKRRDDSLKFVDEQVGRFYEFLKKEGIWENTLFIFLSDHGDNFGEHGVYFCRGGLYDTSIHTPLIIHFPETSKINSKFKNNRIKQLTQSIDIVPTILDLMGDKKNKFDGKSLISPIKNNNPLRKEILVVDGFSNNRICKRTLTKKTITSDKTSCYLCGAIHGPEKEEYNLLEDPEELNRI